jgi:NAD-dependent dihydropyrimidine dehydrogenase PreA subunit
MMFRPIIINEEICKGCNKCVDICPMDVFVANPEKGKPPIVAYPEECWYDGACVYECSLKTEGAIKIITPLAMRVFLLRAENSNLIK